MDSHVVIYFLESFQLIFSSDFLFCDFVTFFDLLDESIVIIFDVTLLKNDGSYFMFSSYFLIAIPGTLIVFFIDNPVWRLLPLFRLTIFLLGLIFLFIFQIVVHVKYSDSIIWIIILCSPFGIGELLVRFSHVFLWRQCEIWSFNDIPEDTIIQLISNFFSIFQT
jgi:hypothetical protein